MKPGYALTHEYKGCTLVQLMKGDDDYQFIVDPDGGVEIVDKTPEGQYVTAQNFVKDASPVALLQRYGDKVDAIRCQSGVLRAIEIVGAEWEFARPKHAAGLERAFRELKRLKEKMHCE